MIYSINKTTGDTEMVSGVSLFVTIPRVEISDTSYSTALESDKFYKFGTLTSFALAIDNEASEDTDHLHEYMFEFTSGATPTTFTYANTLTLWDSNFTVKANKKYQGSVVENVIVMCEVG